jgi:hypothetical protein
MLAMVLKSVNQRDYMEMIYLYTAGKSAGNKFLYI